MKYSHWYRKLFIRTETPEFNNTVIWNTNYDEITPEMVQKHCDLRWNWTFLYNNNDFMSILLFNLDTKDIKIYELNSKIFDVFRKFLENIYDSCLNKKEFIKRLANIYNFNYNIHYNKNTELDLIVKAVVSIDNWYCASYLWTDLTGKTIIEE